ncbi:BCCT family transporter [Citricoccus sp.]|uniref:BCCT family transporter n=1 Tax=Citricoccus sp. TaxID=1978372 RepID=UPI00260F931A|nr:BCCT family transporter [Citricoccus sp.]HRO31623.1 BCCT family transporter [Citricoccus sp.]HRO95138.1 BCCT family transporter [Citricoccus sp.]
MSSPVSGPPHTLSDDSSAGTPPPPRAKILKPVFIPAAVIIIGLVVASIVFANVAGDALTEATTELNEAITSGVGWWYVIAVNAFLVFVLYCAISKVGRIRLGRDDERPEFGLLSWFLMLFSAGMGIGLVFFGVAEPLWNYVAPPGAFGNEPLSSDAARESVGLMMLQWGLHPWGIYAVVGLGLAYMSFRRGRPMSVRWLLEPLIGRQRVEGWIGHAIDVIAIVGTLFGVATSFGFGVSQVVDGIEFYGWMERSPALVIGLIAVVTLIATWSVVSGVHKGLKWLSNFNMSLAAVLALLVFALGPTIFLLQSIPENLGQYLSQLPQTALHVGPFSEDNWEGIWTIAYWGWWTSWAPFVGMFIARISRGRTIREFVVGVLLAPTLVSLVWFTIFGNTGILYQQTGREITVADAETGEQTVNSTTALFQLFEHFPAGMFLGILAMVVVIFFFVTSSDSGSLVIDMMAHGGATSTPVVTRVFWSVLVGVAAAALLVAGGDVAMTALQTLAVSTAAPFSVILVIACISLLRAFRHETLSMPQHIEVILPEGEAAAQTLRTAGAVAPAGAAPAGAPRRDEAVEQLGAAAVDAAKPHRYGREVFRGLGGASMSLSGLATVVPTPGDEPDKHIISYRRVRPSEITVNPQTGAAELADTAGDPLAGETFDTPEFESSQEYLDQGGHHDPALDEMSADLASEDDDAVRDAPVGR